MDAEKQRELKDILTKELESLDRQLAEYGATGEGRDIDVSTFDEGFADSGQATAERAEVLSLVEGLREARIEVAAALRRMDAGTYGTCEKCGGEVAQERLEAVPATRLCMACKQSR